jgi:hypothetical protein
MAGTFGTFEQTSGGPTFSCEESFDVDQQLTTPVTGILMAMNVRFEVLTLDGVWTLTQSGPETKAFGTRSAATAAAVVAACRHHELDGGHASVHLWENGTETTIFETERGDPPRP